MLLQPEKLKEEDQKMVELLCRLSPEIKQAQELALNFASIISEWRVDELREWLIKAAQSELPEFRRFARGVKVRLKDRYID